MAANIGSYRDLFNRYGTPAAPTGTSTGYQPGATQPGDYPTYGLESTTPQTNTGGFNIQSATSRRRRRNRQQMRDVAGQQVQAEREAQRLAELDRQRAYEELVRGRNALTGDPRMQAVWNALSSRYAAGGPFTPELMEQREGTMRSQAALGLQDTRRMAAEDAARRGLAGGLTDYQQAQLGQQASTDLAGQLEEWRRQAAMANDEAMRMVLGQMGGFSTEQAAMQQAQDQLIAQLFAETVREAPDLTSPWLAAMGNLRKPVGGGVAAALR